ncbi:hypothetical protein [Bacillus bombysepticus]|uniref:hypothetical protein n=1 Tax=Bacillus bombysepticus TaxID=658666 RepID=UPI00301689BF
MAEIEMTEKELDDLVDELQNDPSELWEFVSRHSEDKTESEIDAIANELEHSSLDLREFVIHSLNK